MNSMLLFPQFTILVKFKKKVLNGTPYCMLAESGKLEWNLSLLILLVILSNTTTSVTGWDQY